MDVDVRKNVPRTQRGKSTSKTWDGSESSYWDGWKCDQDMDSTASLQWETERRLRQMALKGMNYINELSSFKQLFGDFLKTVLVDLSSTLCFIGDSSCLSSKNSFKVTFPETDLARENI